MFNLQSPTDPTYLTDHEKQHVPVIDFDTDKVNVVVGEILHPNTETNHIAWIELFKNGESVDKKELSYTDAPQAHFEVTPEQGATWSAQAHCTEHGTWEGKSEA